MKNVTYNELIKEVERELITRQRVYPEWERKLKITREVTEHRIKCMEIILKLLKSTQVVQAQQSTLFEAFLHKSDK